MANRASGFLQQMLIAEIHADRHRQREKETQINRRGRGKRESGYPVNKAFFHESVGRINRPASSDQFQKHHPKGEDVRFISQFPGRCIFWGKIPAHRFELRRKNKPIGH